MNIRLALSFVALAIFLAAATSPARADRADDQYAVAAGHYAQRRWPLAREQFETFLAENPNHAKAAGVVFYLAEAQLQTGELASAEERFREYLAREPEGPFARTALFRAGETAYLRGRADSAESDLERFLAAYPQDKLNAYVLPYLGDIALDRDSIASGQNKASVAARRFREGLERFPQGPLQDDCRFGLARALERLNQTDEAERLYLAIAAKASCRLADDAQFHLGALQYATGDHAAAIETFAAFETRWTDSPWRAHARLGTGWALLKLDRPDEAEPCFAAVTTDSRLGVEARYWLGLTQKTRQNWTTAAATLSAAAADAAETNHPLTSALRVHAGNALLRIDDSTSAAAHFNRVLADEAADNEWLDDALRGATKASFRLGDHAAVDRRAAEFDERFAASPLRADVHRTLAQSLIRRNEPDKAIALIAPLLADDGDNANDTRRPEDRYLLALAYQTAKRHDDALAALLPVLDVADEPLRTDALLLHGTLLAAVGQYEEAVASLEAVLAGPLESTHRLTARGRLAVCLARCGRCDRAKEIFAALVEDHPGDELLGPVTEQLADAAYASGEAEWAAVLYGRLLAECPDHRRQPFAAKLLAGLAWSQLKAGRAAEAADTFAELLEANPPAELAAEAALARGRLLERLERPDQALLMYDRVIDEHPDAKEHPESLWAAARLRDRLEQNREAAALYERLATEYPDRAETDAVLYQWAWVLDELGQPEASQARFEQVRQKYPESRYAADAAYRLARAALQAKDLTGADALATQAFDASDDPAIREHALYLRGQIAAEREQWDRVGELFSALSEQFPDSANRLVADCWVAEAAYRRGDFDEAGRLLDRLAQQTEDRRDPWLAIVALRRAQVLAQRDAWTEAMKIASAIEADFPDFGQQYEVDYLIGRCLANRADFDRARRHYRKAIDSTAGAKTETAAMAQWMIGESYFHQKDYESALREYLKVEILYAYPTWRAASLLQAGKCHRELGQPNEADRLFAQLIEQYPDTSFALDAERLAGGRRVETVGTRPN